MNFFESMRRANVDLGDENETRKKLADGADADVS
jgi:hypothetical protein